MSLDFAQIDTTGAVTGETVRLDRRAHLSIIHGLAESEYPLLGRMRDYYDDASYAAEELHELALEVRKIMERPLPNQDLAIVERMLWLIRDSAEKGLRIEAIAD
jgi:hypothetical protein